MRPSLLIIPANETPGVLMPQIPFNGTADFTVSRTTTPANNSTRVNSSGLIEIVNDNVPRIDYLNQSCPALLVEASGTNQIRNNSMVGAVTGSPGTLPTNWTIPGAAGLTREIVGIGTENGISYIDIKLSGTATGTETEIRLESPTQIVAANGQTWTESIYLKSISQPAPPLSYRLFMIQRTILGTIVANTLSPNVSVDTSLNRFSFTTTLAGGPTVERVQPSIFISLTNGASYDFTIRIGYPQMEQSSFATSVIPTTSGTRSRAADVISASGALVSGLIGQTEGTIYAEVDIRNMAKETYILEIDDGVNANRVLLRSLTDNKMRGSIVATTSSGIIGISSATFNAGIIKIAFAYKSGDLAISVNGATALTASGTFTFGASLNRVTLGSIGGGGSQLNDRIRAAALYTTRLSNDDLIRLTLPSTYVTYNDMALGLAYTIK